jgi:hypothetical protein
VPAANTVAPASGNPLYETLVTPTVTIGGQSAPVVWFSVMFMRAIAACQTTSLLQTAFNTVILDSEPEMIRPIAGASRLLIGNVQLQEITS